MPVTFYFYPGCSTCRNARSWLDKHAIAYEARDIAKDPPAREWLRAILRASGQPLRRLFNTSGQVYRAGNYAERLKTMDEDTALAELASQGMLIRRPLLLHGETALIGFDAAAYEQALLGVR
jgi:arsenate reductase